MIGRGAGHSPHWRRLHAGSVSPWRNRIRCLPSRRFASALGWSTQARWKRGSPSRTAQPLPLIHGCSGCYNAGCSADVRAALLAVHRLAPTSPLWLAGISLGGNVVVKLAIQDLPAGKPMVIRAESQGCADLGICYPPNVQQVTIASPEASIAPDGKPAGKKAWFN